MEVLVSEARGWFTEEGKAEVAPEIAALISAQAFMGGAVTLGH